MADAVRLGLTASRAANGRHGGQAASGAWRHGALAFHHVLAAAMAGARSPRATPVAGSGVQTAALHVPLGMAHPRWIEKPDSALPAQSDAALSHAMTLEGVPSSWQSGLRFIMAQESGGQVNARNPVHSARGLFQLTAANYHLNPNGAGSFGNAVEEAQGGIRYIQQRYGTADNAVTFWRQHHWY
ncbi:MAG: transglycosylase SLT domain-containing protein [Acetobacteraceae bacterium]|jgi:Transglycosylase SLT domain